MLHPEAFMQFVRWLLGLPDEAQWQCIPIKHTVDPKRAYDQQHRG